MGTHARNERWTRWHITLTWRLHCAVASVNFHRIHGMSKLCKRVRCILTVLLAGTLNVRDLTIACDRGLSWERQERVSPEATAVTDANLQMGPERMTARKRCLCLCTCVSQMVTCMKLLYIHTAWKHWRVRLSSPERCEDTVTVTSIPVWRSGVIN